MQCYLHDACYCSMLLAWWMLMQYVTCMVDVIAVCYLQLHDACCCSMSLAWWMLLQCVTCMMHVNAVCYLHSRC